jgi:hypothetical protein
MCYTCDTWAPCDVEYDGHDFCSTSCRDQYIESKKKDKQKRIEEIDKQVHNLESEKRSLMKQLGYTSDKKYPWN